MHHKLCSGEWGLDSNTKTQKCARGYLISLLVNALMQKLDSHNIDIFNHSMVYICRYRNCYVHDWRTAGESEPIIKDHVKKFAGISAE